MRSRLGNEKHKEKVALPPRKRSKASLLEKQNDTAAPTKESEVTDRFRTAIVSYRMGISMAYREPNLGPRVWRDFGKSVDLGLGETICKQLRQFICLAHHKKENY